MRIAKPKARTALAAAATVGLTAAVLGVVGTGSASAEPVSLKLNYTCVFPQIDEQQISVVINTDIPKTIKVNTSVPKLAIHAVSTVNEDTTAGLGLVGAATLEGQAKTAAVVAVPQGTVSVKPTFTIAQTKVPESGSFNVVANGSVPPLTFRKTGHGKITVGDMTLILTVRNAEGKAVDMDDDGNESFASPCQQVPGQKNILAEFDIVS
ncbi:hypothetical protein RKE29_11515 [Streptomyces sp. B1866]|uniref:DUF6801 domain-containing protein n=1 Tax=Streptomyces sp. B1866 TaxID=3075431 RepID=UPI00288F4232|nr:DUF6801 domain-containing protein [Streptomyces sp. B1866]MDT3397266.1 hypothetical protein [Streptomyces sp. B1866]